MGPFDSVVQESDRFICDGNLTVQFTVMPNASIVEVPDDWISPAEKQAQQEAAQKAKDEFNAKQKTQRLGAYRNESDPIFFKAQRGEATMDEWKAKIAEIDQRLPYQT